MTVLLACNFLATLFARVRLVALACSWALVRVVTHIGMVTLVAVATLTASSCSTLVTMIAVVMLLNACYIPLIQIRAGHLLKTANTYCDACWFHLGAVDRYAELMFVTVRRLFWVCT